MKPLSNVFVNLGITILEKKCTTDETGCIVRSYFLIHVCIELSCFYWIKKKKKKPLPSRVSIYTL